MEIATLHAIRMTPSPSEICIPWKFCSSSLRLKEARGMVNPSLLRGQSPRGAGNVQEESSRFFPDSRPLGRYPIKAFLVPLACNDALLVPPFNKARFLEASHHVVERR